MDTHLAFGLRRSDVQDRILIPKYYDPDLKAAVGLAKDAGFDTPELGELLLPGDAGSRLGDWVPREYYGSGPLPYVRTSDLSHWRIRPDFKKGVSEDVYERYAARQGVFANDILMVAHGSYLVGAVAMVVEGEERLLLQDHIFRLRVDPACGVDPRLILAALSTAFVRRQVRSRQFSADIIDKIGDRHLAIRIPLPQDVAVRQGVVDSVAATLSAQDAKRSIATSITGGNLAIAPSRTDSRLTFPVRRDAIRDRVLVPKYYDPDLEDDLAAQMRALPIPWVSLGELVARGVMTAETGVEVGKMAYGTGPIPFMRTTDLAEWEMKLDPKQGVSEEIYTQHARRAGLLADDVLVVRDGTYLVGSSAIVSSDDVPALFCGGIYRLRSTAHDEVDPGALLAYLNLPIVRRQMRAKQFTRDVIDTLGYRLLEVLIPSPSQADSPQVSATMQEVRRSMAATKRAITSAIDALEPPSPIQVAGRPAWSMR